MNILHKMRKLFLLFSIILNFQTNGILAETIELDSDYCDWYFSIGKNKKQYLGIVPGSNINDLICNKIIPNPYLDNNIEKIKWVEDSLYTYVTVFNLEVRATHNFELLCEGLDTYADVYLNNQLVLKSNNMFVAYHADITSLLRDGSNLLKIVFRNTIEIGKQKANRYTIKYPADNEEGEVKISPFVRKAAFQFGWDINPRLISCGIWQPIKIISTEKSVKNVEQKKVTQPVYIKPLYKLQKDKDVEGESFAFFTNDKKPLQKFIYGANYVPYNMYPLPLKNYKRVAHIQQNQGLPNRNDYYRKIFSELKNYGCNMIRIWGGGWYEDDYFYDLADSMQIAVWQDFMFANTMYPGDDEWINIVKPEVEYQINRLKKHSCIVLWSGNNEIEVAWKNWGWQKKYNYSNEDSVKLINDYRQLFEQLIPNELKKQKIEAAYISSSPMSNWGRSEDFKIGDNHYWGIWHGEAPLEDFYNHVPRFASEYGMPSLGTNECVKKYYSNHKLNNFAQSRMKSYKGVKLLNSYMANYLPMTMNDSLLSYTSRYLQFKALKMAYNAHLYHFPYCAGSLFWQFNESWPGLTWAAIDFSGNRKIPPYATSYALIIDQKCNIKLKAQNGDIIKSRHINLIIDLKDIDGNLQKQHSVKINIHDLQKGVELNPYLFFDSTIVKKGYINIAIKESMVSESLIWDTILFIAKEKELSFKKPQIQFNKVDGNHLKIKSDVLVGGLFLTYSGDEKIEFNQNFLTLEAGVEKIISLDSSKLSWQIDKINFQSFYDLKN